MPRIDPPAELKSAQSFLAAALGNIQAAERALKRAGHEGLTVGTQLARSHLENTARRAVQARQRHGSGS